MKKILESVRKTAWIARAFSLTTVCIVLALPVSAQDQDPAPLRLAIARLTHDHVHWVFNRPGKSDVELVGIHEPDSTLRTRYAERYGLDEALFFADLEAMLDAVKPEAVSAFGSIREHLEVVEAAAPRGVHVMVEKPLAFRMEDARRMHALAERHGIHLITNYETTWYPSVHAARQAVREGAVGEIRKVVVRDGHPGPKEIGVSEEFLAWLTDPEENGAGALIDFGCYGANLVTWLMDGAAPRTVTAVTQQIKPDVYPHVDDEATILLTYPGVQAIVQASWNWPFNRKDMHVYGRTGYLSAPDGSALRIRRSGQEAPEDAGMDRTSDAGEVRRLERRPTPYDDPFSYLAAVVRGHVRVSPGDLSSIENNVTVVRILDAARQSARSGRTVVLK